MGSVNQLLRQNPGFNPAEQPSLSSEDYFVWSRVDGHTSLRDLILMLGVAPDRAIGILRKLRRCGALLVAGEAPGSVGLAPPLAGAPPAAAPVTQPPAPVPAQGSGVVPQVSQRGAAAPSSLGGRAPGTVPPAAPGSVAGRGPGTVPPAAPGRAETEAPGRATSATDPPPLRALPVNLTPEERAALAAPVDLSEQERVAIIAALRAVHTGDYFALLAVSAEADKRELKRAYFRVSKEFHPDRFFGKSLGIFAEWTSLVFETAKKAFEVLNDERQRDRYAAARAGGAAHAPTQPVAAPAQTKQEHALELFEQACALEVRGEFDQARRLFAAALRLDPKARYLLRAARCAQRAGSFREAIEWASKAVALSPDNPSYLRALADAQRAAGDLERAEATLVHALTLKSENDVLAGELAADLERLRRERATGAEHR